MSVDIKNENSSEGLGDRPEKKLDNKLNNKLNNKPRRAADSRSDNKSDNKADKRSGGKASGKTNSAAVYTLVVFVSTFFCACTITFVSNVVLADMDSFVIGFVLLLAVILLGVAFDIIGTAVSVCGKTHLNAKASRRIPGAKKALLLTRNASRVANICNDVVGDICGTVSGGIGTALAAVLISSGGWAGLLCSVVISGCIAALTVAGKALGKGVAIEKADEIIFGVGRLLDLPAVVRHSLKWRRSRRNGDKLD